MRGLQMADKRGFAVEKCIAGRTNPLSSMSVEFVQPPLIATAEHFEVAFFEGAGVGF